MPGDLGVVRDDLAAGGKDLAASADDLAAGGPVAWSRLLSGSFGAMAVDDELIGVTTADSAQTLTVHDAAGSLLATLDDGALFDWLAGKNLYYRVLTGADSNDAGFALKLYTQKVYLGVGSSAQVLSTSAVDRPEDRAFADDGRTAVLMENPTLKPYVGFLADIVYFQPATGNRVVLFAQRAADFDNFLRFSPKTNHFYAVDGTNLIRVQQGDPTATPVTIATNVPYGEPVFSQDGSRIAVALNQRGLAVGSTADATVLSPAPTTTNVNLSGCRFVGSSYDVLCVRSVTSPPIGACPLGTDNETLVRVSDTDGSLSVVGMLQPGCYIYHLVAAAVPSTTLLNRLISEYGSSALTVVPANATSEIQFVKGVGYLGLVQPSGRFIAVHDESSSTIGRDYLEIGAPDGSSLGTLPAGGVKYGYTFVDDDHVLFVDGNQTLMEYVVPTQTSVPLRSNVYAFHFSPTTRRVTVMVRGTSADGIYVGPLP